MMRSPLPIGAPALALLLAACAAQGPKAPPNYVPVPTPVPVSCVPKTFPPAGRYASAADLARTPDGPALFQMLYEDWLARVARMNLTEPVVKHCAEAAPAP